MATYSAHARKGQGISFSGKVDIHHGYWAEVHRNGKVIWTGNLFTTEKGALLVARRRAAEFRTYRQQHGEGQEDVWERQRAAKAAERRRRDRIEQKRNRMYELMQPLAEDLELVKDWLPKQALARLEQIRAIIAYVETDPPKETSAIAA